MRGHPRHNYPAHLCARVLIESATLAQNKIKQAVLRVEGLFAGVHYTDKKVVFYRAV